MRNLRFMRWLVGIFFLMISYFPVDGQKEFTLACIAFYNLENLFDTLDSPDTDDCEFTPKGPNLYTSEVYWEKQEHLSRVIREIVTEYTPDGPALLGVSEIENKSVLEDLLRQPAIAKHGYKIIHQDYKDSRDVDVTLLYQPKYFIPEVVHYYPLPTHKPGEEEDYSRDILIVIGQLNNEKVAISVNHWPSRRGGEQNTAHHRNAAAIYNRNFLDRIAEHHQVTKSIVMDDLNDDPINDSVRKYLKAKRTPEALGSQDMYNPFAVFYKQGLGTTAYQDAWSLFDQVIVSRALTSSEYGFSVYKAGIHQPPYLLQKSGPYKGYPFRTYSNGVYAGGYSDHFPVYILLLKEKT